MDFTKISYEQVLTMSSTLSNSATSMKDILDKVTVEFAKIGDAGTWSGTAASENKEEFDRLSKEFHKYNEAIQKGSEFLNSMVENYKAVDKAVSGM